MELVHADASEVWLVIEDPSVKALFPYQKARNLITWFVCFCLKPWRYLNKGERYLGSFEET